MTFATGTQATFGPPIVAAKRWLQDVTFPPERPLIDVSQAAPTAPPPKPLREAMAEAVLHTPQAHLYGPVFGMPELRDEIAQQWSRDYGGDIRMDQVAITSGCNQAFCAALSALCTKGDEVIIPTPWYFNHKMWIDMAGLKAVPLDTGADLLPDPAAAAQLIGPRTKAIALVTPNNPGGTEYDAELVAAFFDLARAHGLKLILDETYRDFDGRDGAPHALFKDPDWPDTLIHLYSFSKAFRLTGHRVGAIIAAQPFQAEVEKFLDTVTICPNQLGQMAALWGLQHLGAWRAQERQEILTRRAAIHAAMPEIEPQGWRLLGCGAFFAYVQHPFEKSSDLVARDLVREASILALPATMFCPSDAARGHRELRLAFANVDSTVIGTLFDRFAGLGWPLAPKTDSA